MKYIFFYFFCISFLPLKLIYGQEQIQEPKFTPPKIVKDTPDDKVEVFEYQYLPKEFQAVDDSLLTISKKIILDFNLMSSATLVFTAIPKYAKNKYISEIEAQKVKGISRRLSTTSEINFTHHIRYFKGKVVLKNNLLTFTERNHLFVLKFNVAQKHAFKVIKELAKGKNKLWFKVENDDDSNLIYL